MNYDEKSESERTGQWERMLAARAYLAEVLGGHLEISLIDIGYAPVDNGEEKQIVIRIHLRRPPGEVELEIPEKPDVPIHLVYGDYSFEFHE